MKIKIKNIYYFFFFLGFHQHTQKHLFLHAISSIQRLGYKFSKRKYYYCLKTNLLENKIQYLYTEKPKCPFEQLKRSKT